MNPTPNNFIEILWFSKKIISEKSDEHFEEKVAYLSCLRQKQDLKALTSVAFPNSSLILSVAKPPLHFPHFETQTLHLKTSRQVFDHLAMLPWALQNDK